MRKILFVCTGNTCRSPMAEAIFRNKAAQLGMDIEVRSAGVMAADRMPISEHASQILQQKGIHDELTSSAVTASTVEWADLILTMTMNHKRILLEQFPNGLDKVFTLKEYVHDDAEVKQFIAQREQFISELQMKQALSQEITEEEHQQWLEMELKMPNFDIQDPFGGSMEQYEQCACEIENELDKLLKKLSES